MSKLTKPQINLPANIEELSKFVLIGREKITAIRAEIRAIDKIGLAEEVRRQKLEEAQMISETVLDAEVKIGTLTAQMPKAERLRTDLLPDTAVAQTKTQTIQKLGFSPKQVERYEILARNPEIVEQAKAEARKNDDIVSRSFVIEKIKSAERKKQLIEVQAFEEYEPPKPIENLEFVEMAIAQKVDYAVNFLESVRADVFSQEENTHIYDFIVNALESYKANCEFKSFYKTVEGNEGDKCLYSTRLDVYGCGCQHNCAYCYAKSLLSFRNLWNEKEPKIADMRKVAKIIQQLPKGTIVRLGGMTDCFQPLEKTERVALKTIKLLNKYGVGYLIVTKSHLVAETEYLKVLDKNLAHFQISVTCLDDKKASVYENSSPPSMRIKAIYTLQELGFDVSLRVSPFMEEYIDFNSLNELNVHKCLIEFLRVNSFIKQWLQGVDYSKYTVYHGGYFHLPLEEKLRVLKKVKLPNVSICEDVTEHYEYWRERFNPNKEDCCNLY